MSGGDENFLTLKEKGGFEVDATMKRGVEGEEFEDVPDPEVSIVHLRQHVGRENEPIVEPGDEVSEGEKIGDSERAETAPVPSPVSGVVERIGEAYHAGLGERSEAVFVRRTDGGGEGETLPSFEVDELEETQPERLVEAVKEAGIVGLGGAGFPAHVKLSSEGISHLIINAKESDPNVACDVQLMHERPREIVDGIRAMARMLEVDDVTFTVRSPESRFSELKSSLDEEGITMTRIKPSYSVGQEKLLIEEVLGEECPCGDFPPDIGVVVHNVSTVYAVCRALFEGEPLISRGLTFISDGGEAKNLWVKVGTPLRDILRHLGVEPGKFRRVVFGSLFMGETASGPETPTIKTTNGIYGFGAEWEDPYADPQRCIRCGYCNEICPVDIYPILILEAQKEGDASRLRKLHAEDCIDCGLCSYVCPVRIKFTPFLRRAASEVREKMR